MSYTMRNGINSVVISCHAFDRKIQVCESSV